MTDEDEKMREFARSCKPLVKMVTSISRVFRHMSYLKLSLAGHCLLTVQLGENVLGCHDEITRRGNHEGLRKTLEGAD